jgi:hypothetical protein
MNGIARSVLHLYMGITYEKNPDGQISGVILKFGIIQ